jgi:hypothetical protein
MSASTWEHRDTQPVGLTPEQLSLIYDGKTIDEKFADYHRGHPEVYSKLVTLARQAKAAGFDHYGMKALIERLRWHMTVERQSTEPFKINNVFTRCYARAIMMCEPDLAGFFETRKLRSKGAGN